MNSASIAHRETITTRYEDPVDVIWQNAALQMGMHIERSSEVFAAWDGKGTLQIGTPETLDPDDCLAQMILHESCHALVEGPDAFGQPDWGIDIGDPKQRVREHACLRLQAAITQPFGLRQFFAATTTYRTYYDHLPQDPLQAGDDPAIEIARGGWERAQHGPWSKILNEALTSTQIVAAAVREIASPDSIWSTTADIQ